jgi:hypothetical protein
MDASPSAMNRPIVAAVVLAAYLFAACAAVAQTSQPTTIASSRASALASADVIRIVIFPCARPPALTRTPSPRYSGERECGVPNQQSSGATVKKEHKCPIRSGERRER